MPRLTPRSAALAALAAAYGLAACGGGGADAPPPVPAAPAVVAGDALRARLPARVGALDRAEVTTEVQGALGAEVSRATARYGSPDGPAVVLTLTDLATAEMVERMGYGWGLGAAPGADRLDGRPAQTEEGPTGASVRVLVAERFLVEAEGPDRDLAEAAVRAVDLGALAAAAGP